MKTAIVCTGTHGRAVLYGRVEGAPMPGDAVVVHGARMILEWDGTSGLFGLATKGPPSGTRITAAVTTACVVRQIIYEPHASEALDAWPIA